MKSITQLRYCLSQLAPKVAAVGRTQAQADAGAGMLLFDNFDRANTTPGNIGTANIGGPLVLLQYPGSFPLVASTQGQITSGVFTAPESAPNTVVYATSELDITPQGMGMNASWMPGTGAGATSVVLATGTNDQYISTMIHLVLTQIRVQIQVREAGGAFVVLSNLVFPTAIPSDGTPVRFEAEFIGTTCIVTVSHPVNGTQRIQATDARLQSCAGPFVFYELFHVASTSAAIPSIHSVWATAPDSATPLTLETNRAQELQTPLTGSTVSMANDSRDGTYSAALAGPLDALTVNLPDLITTRLGQRRTFSTTHAIRSITFASTGASILSNTVSLAAGESVTFERISTVYWVRVAGGTQSANATLGAVPTTGTTVTMAQSPLDGTTWLNPAGTLASLTVELPARAVSVVGQRRTITTTQLIQSLSVVSTGGTIIGSVTSLAAGDAITFEYVSTTGVWVCVSTPEPRRVNTLTTPADGSTYTAEQTKFDGTHAFAPAAALATLAVELPANAVSIVGQRRTITTSKLVRSLTITSTGATILGNVVTLAEGASLTFEKVADSYWACVSYPPPIRLTTFTSPASGDTVTLTQNHFDGTHGFAPAGTLATLTVVLPADAVSIVGQRRTIATSQTITSLSITSSGASILGTVTTLPLYTSVTFQKMAAGFWQRVA